MRLPSLDVLQRDPANRAIGLVDDEKVLRLLLQRVAARGRVIAHASSGHGPEGELAHAPQRQAFEPRSAPTNRATNSDAGLARISAAPRTGRACPCLHDRDEVAHLDRLVDVVGDEQDRLGEVLLEAQELVLEPFADDRIDGPEGLVHQHDRRVGREGLGHADALALAATQLRRVAVAVLPGLEPDEREELIGPLSLAVLRPADQTGTVATFSPIVWWGKDPSAG